MKTVAALAVGSGLMASITGVSAQVPAAVLFDKPVLERAGPKISAPSNPEAKCTYFPSFMVRDLTDGPTAQAPMIVPGTGMPCTTAAYPGGKSVDLSDMSFEGRKGPYLFFAAMDGNGTSGFAIVDADTARVLLRDSVATVGPASGKPYTKLGIGAEGALSLRYNRGVEAGCSLVENAARCWAKLVTENVIPKEMAADVPKPDICAASYRKSKALRDNPGIIFYSAEIVLSRDGKVQNISRGKIGCEAQP
ncbi:MAG: hypothetical protein ACRCUE_10960 [Bosea sp. (in: a-proteobacteria)]